MTVGGLLMTTYDITARNKTSTPLEEGFIRREKCATSRGVWTIVMWDMMAIIYCKVQFPGMRLTP